MLKRILNIFPFRIQYWILYDRKLCFVFFFWFGSRGNRDRRNSHLLYHQTCERNTLLLKIVSKRSDDQIALWSPSQSLPCFTFQSTKSIDGTLSYNTETFRNHQLQYTQHHLKLHYAIAWKRYNGSIKRSHKLQPCCPIRNILPPYFHLCKSPKSRHDFTCT